MRELHESIVTQAALKAGLPEGRIFGVASADNLTLPRPRIEIDYLPDSYQRTGRKLAVTRAGGIQTTKRELYEATCDLTANVLADDAAWLAAFEYDFVAAFPRGVNDARGNWVQIRIERATFSTPPGKRVKEKEIKVFTKVNTLFALRFTGRVTQEEEIRLIQTINIMPKFRR